MKDRYPSIGLGRFCRLLGITRQAYYQFCWRSEDITTEQQLVLDQVRQLRSLHPVIGTRKLYCLLQPFLLDNQIKIGRDALFDLLAVNKLLVRKRKRSVKTTQSYHWFRRYPSLLKNWDPTGPGQLWVADITYVSIASGFLYLSLITDAYSHKIMGYHIADSLESIHTTKALEMAIEQLPVEYNGLIHHSDRGIQYCSYEYVAKLKQRGIKISMTESGDPLENPIAERINGIIKQEYLDHYVINNASQAMELLHLIVNRYNTQRPHQSINMLPPQTVHQYNLRTNRKWPKSKTVRNIVNPLQD